MMVRKNWVLAIALGLLGSTPAWPQAAPEKESAAQSAKQEAARPRVEKKKVLADATRVSTSAAASNAARQATEKDAARKSPEDAADSDVLEFRPGEQATGSAAGAVVAPSKEKSVLKSIHGTAYGSTGIKGTENRAGGAAVGASSKSGKTSVYLETERSRETSPPPR